MITIKNNFLPLLSSLNPFALYFAHLILSLRTLPKKLQGLKVDYGQGYGIEQPKPIEEMFALNKNQESPSFKVIHNKP